jgi:hypothetical protein
VKKRLMNSVFVLVMDAQDDKTLIKVVQTQKATHKRRCSKTNNDDQNKPAANKNKLYKFYKCFFVFK